MEPPPPREESDWTELTEWWLAESAAEAYAEEVIPLFLEIMPPAAGRVWLDAGCGDGAVADRVTEAGEAAVGADVNPELAARAARRHPTVRLRLPDLSCIRDRSLDGAYAVLTLEHIADRERFFSETARVVRPGGALAAVINHPVYTAPGSGPILDPSDGEIFWRFGDYLTPGVATEPAGGEQVAFHHLPIGLLLTQAAAAGWSLRRVLERGVGSRAAARDPILARHGQIPHLMALRWSLAPWRGLPDEVVAWLGNHESELALAAAAERGEHDADIRETLREMESEQRATQ